MSGGLVGGRFARALLRAADRAGAAIVIDAHREEAWSSATFSGARHVVEARAATSAALAEWLARVGEEELVVPGHLVAELTVQACAREAGETRFRLNGTTVTRG